MSEQGTIEALHHDRLEVVAADVLDATAVDTAVAGSDAVLSALGVPASKDPIHTYSRGMAAIVAVGIGAGLGRAVTRRWRLRREAARRAASAPSSKS